MASGILNVDKPAGPTSFGVVRSVQRLPGVSKVGHGGTLDPMACGVLPVLVNAATRLADFVHLWPKTYLATVRLGATSDTDDAQGTITPAREAGPISRHQIESLLPSFTGRIPQVPPAYSALKRKGEAAYRRARRGETVVLEAREVRIDRLILLDYDPGTASITLEVHSGGGTYVRSLARDLGAALGCGGYLAALTRLAVGPLRREDAVAPGALATMGNAWTTALLPMDLPLRDWPAIVLDARGEAAVRHGQAVAAPSEGRGRYRMLDEAGGLVAWGDVDGDRLRPRAVFEP
jgi:tRNA pseudouridine55 synthase